MPHASNDVDTSSPSQQSADSDGMTSSLQPRQNVGLPQSWHFAFSLVPDQRRLSASKFEITRSRDPKSLKTEGCTSSTEASSLLSPEPVVSCGNVAPPIHNAALYHHKADPRLASLEQMARLSVLVGEKSKTERRKMERRHNRMLRNQIRKLVLWRSIKKASRSEKQASKPCRYGNIKSVPSSPLGK